MLQGGLLDHLDRSRCPLMIVCQVHQRYRTCMPLRSCVSVLCVLSALVREFEQQCFDLLYAGSHLTLFVFVCCVTLTGCGMSSARQAQGQTGWEQNDDLWWVLALPLSRAFDVPFASLLLWVRSTPGHILLEAFMVHRRTIHPRPLTSVGILPTSTRRRLKIAILDV